MRVALARAGDGEPLDRAQAAALLHARGEDLATLLGYAARTRDAGLEAAGRPGVITYSKKVFIPLTRLCRDRCGYCTFATVPGRLDSPYLSPDEVLAIARQGAALGCKEALFTLGDRPEARWKPARQWLDAHGYEDTLSYVRAMAIRVLEETGLLPHLNPGVLSLRGLPAAEAGRAVHGHDAGNHRPAGCSPRRARRTSARPTRTRRSGCGCWRTPAAARCRSPPASSSGSARRGPSARTPSAPSARSPGSTAGSRKSSCRTSAPSRTRRCADTPDAELAELAATIAVTRLVLGPAARVQAPPNLVGRDHQLMLDAGIDDWGGVSPLTPDHVNPERPWPQLDTLADITATAGFKLRERLTIYPSYLREPWLDESVAAHVAALADPLTGLADEAADVAGQALARAGRRGPASGGRLPARLC